MSLSAGTRLGPYEIQSALGAGGMGEVYRARDTSLNRDVALKVLPESFAGDADRVARFQREAQVLASLNHPNIAGIYGIEASTSPVSLRALVMELVEGEDLSTIMARGPVPWHDALPLARQIADALEAAHEAGIVHRDLKPQNIKVRADGMVKVLDFGLAKALDANASGATAAAMNSPTMTARATQMGMILGTAAYMSPEQARGKAVDRRADIWAFGVVLYEMLTGRRAFQGDNISDVLAAVLRQDIDFTVLPTDTPAPIRRLLTRSLTRDPKQRLADASTIRLDIDQALNEPAGASGPTRAPVASTGTSRALLAVCAVLALTTIALAFVHFGAPPPTAPPEMRLDIATPATAWGADLELSPDGRVLAYVAPGGTSSQSHVWLRRLDRADAQMLPGTEGARWPFWSPDSSSIGYFAGGKVRTIDATGGTPFTISDAALNPFGGTWNADGVILFRTNQGLWRVKASGGPATMIITGLSAVTPRFPRFLPDGRHFVYFIYTAGADATGLYLASLDDPTPTKLGPSESTGRWVSPNLLLFVDQGKLVARALDLEARTFSGEPQTIADGLGDVVPGHGAFSVATTGLIAYRPQPGNRPSRLLWVDRSGNASGTPLEFNGNVQAAEFSYDGARLAVDLTVNGNRDLYINDLVSGGLTRLTFGNSIEGFPTWSRDHRTIVYEVNATGGFDIHARASSGAGAEEVWLQAPGLQWPQEFSVDGKLLLYYDNKNAGDLMALPLEGPDRTPIPIATTPATEGQGGLSPDGRWVAYTRTDAKGGGVFVQGFPAASGEWQVAAGGHSPRWSSTGTELFFVADDTMMSVRVRATPSSFAFDPPARLFPVRLAQRNARPQYAVDNRGRFLLNTAVEITVTTPVTVLLNWRPGKI
jgi:Tol biopolymer transport system component